MAQPGLGVRKFEVEVLRYRLKVLPNTYKTLGKVRAYFELLRYPTVFVVRTSLGLLR